MRNGFSDCGGGVVNIHTAAAFWFGLALGMILGALVMTFSAI